MATFGNVSWLIFLAIFFSLLAAMASGEYIFLRWHVEVDMTMEPVVSEYDQPVITVHGMYPEPLMNVTTNDSVHVNVINNMDEPLLLTWNDNEQRLNSWVSGTNCLIRPGESWTYVFRAKDQIGTLFCFPTINFHRSGGGSGAVRVYNPSTTFGKGRIGFGPIRRQRWPIVEFKLLIGHWCQYKFKNERFNNMNRTLWAYGTYKSPGIVYCHKIKGPP